MIAVGQEFLILPLENEVMGAKPTEDLHLMPSPPIRGINDCSGAEGTIACRPTSHTFAEEAGPGGRVWCHMSHLLWPQLNGSTATKKSTIYGLWTGQKGLLQDLKWKIPRHAP